MSALLAPFKVLTALSIAIGDQARKAGTDPAAAAILAALEIAYSDAAGALEAQMQAEAGGNPDPSIPAQMAAKKPKRGAG
jgi:hypothetical protein